MTTSNMGIHSFHSVFSIEKNHNTKTLILHKFQAIIQNQKNPKRIKKKIALKISETRIIFISGTVLYFFQNIFLGVGGWVGGQWPPSVLTWVRHWVRAFQARSSFASIFDLQK